MGNIIAAASRGESGNAYSIALGLEVVVNVDVVNWAVPGSVDDDNYGLFCAWHVDWGANGRDIQRERMRRVDGSW